MGFSEMRDQHAISVICQLFLWIFSGQSRANILCGRSEEALFDNPQAYSKVCFAVWLWFALLLPPYFLIENQPLYLGGPDSGS